MARLTRPGTALFDTPLGRCGLAWTARGLDRILLPFGDERRLPAALAAAAPDRAPVDRPPVPVARAVERLRNHLGGQLDDLRSVPVDLDGVTPFAATIYKRLRRVGPGRIITYGELAAAAGRPGASRAVGSAMASNPVPLVVPCHRVLGAGRRLGGFSADAGPALKARILFIEGVVLDPRHAAGIEAVRRAEPRLEPVIAAVGPYLPELGPMEDPYDALIQAIVYQQLSMKAAATIAGRVRALTPGDAYPRPADLARIRDARLRKAGLSRQKISYLRDLAARVADGRLALRALRRLPDEAVIQALTQVRGLGVWSAQMFLIFHLGRLDVWPVGDLGLRQAAARLSGMDPNDLEGLSAWGQRFAPYRSVATWYLWRSLEAGGL